MSKELNMIGVDVWLAATVYVVADSEEHAVRLVSQNYAGTREKADTYDLNDGKDLDLDGNDFMSSAITLYGPCADSKLAPTREPLRDAAPDLLAALKRAMEAWPDWENDEPVNGGDMVEWFGEWRQTALAAITKAEGGA